jgi:hypothetical protein
MPGEGHAVLRTRPPASNQQSAITATEKPRVANRALFAEIGVHFSFITK